MQLNNVLVQFAILTAIQQFHAIKYFLLLLFLLPPLPLNVNHAIKL